MVDEGLFSEHIYSAKFQEEFKKYWHSQTDFKNVNLEIISKPFRICRISNFLKNERFIENLKCELENHDHKRKVTDLYQFEKTDDLFGASDYCSQMLYKSFQKDLASWMERNTDIKLNKTISMSSARYYETDYLLCHDDNMGDRRIAYILYLSKGWTEEDGGALELFDTDEHGSPNKVVRSLVPEYNSLIFFEVVENSYHQVAEVMTDDKCRWSINGWFHGPLKECYQAKSPRFDLIRNFIEPNTTEIELSSWISKRYLLPSIIDQIHENVMKEPYTFLESFLKESVYEQIANDLTSQDISWRMAGPADIRHYEIADEQTLPKLLKDFYNLFKSLSFFELLWKYTGLDLVPDEKTMRPKMTIELQRWSAGCYTLLYDKSLVKDGSDDAAKTSQLDENTSITAGASTSKSLTEIILDTSSIKRKRDGSFPSTTNLSHKKKVTKYVESDVSTQSLSKDSKHGTDTNEISLRDEEISSDTSASDSENNSTNDEYTLDVIMQFHTVNDQGVSKTGDTIDFIDPNQEQGTLIQIPALDNHLCLVYRSLMVYRLQQYLNHLYEGYSYTLMCSYYE
ncbi:2-oxoglutarate and iron-dependent oxygenase domain-containing protein 1 [Camponotus floridanus]|uniref:uS12 prolyl 3-hydroxylase n=2 Tax=Camponotus floridanus TaxID=104421 RepID=E1ZXS4_CAMFO|nr:prolyl 3-hydroxylase OGFOD1 isoform X1 [Camponotus floridanus]EFN74046.1 2-oxoglutarate and iron-dependent oxygenase domain-containing protein 1 [Camponotus floridanus]